MATIKEKILSFCESQGIKKSRIAQRIDVSETNFIGKNLQSSIGSDAIVKFLTEFPEVSAEWLLRDKEPMIINTEQSFSFSNSGAGAMVNGVNNGTVQKNEGDCQECALLKAKDETIAAQKVTIEALSKR